MSEMRDRARDAVSAVLKRHGYNLPGISDLAAGAAIRAMREPTEDMIRSARRSLELNDECGYGMHEICKGWRALIDAALDA